MVPRSLRLGYLALALNAACGGNSFPAGSAGSRSAADLRPDKWNELSLGGDTRCANGDPYAFWVHPGTTKNLVIDFMGGGACWNDATCAAGDFSQDVDGLRTIVDMGYTKGIYDRVRKDNPFAQDWYVLVPYCTGDIHWGNAEATYKRGDSTFTIQHKGAVNARAVLDWTEKNVPDPARVFVTGCSAGAYGAALWSSRLMKHYGNASVVQFGDSGAGIITIDFFRKSFPSWKAEAAFPGFIDALDPAKVDLREKSLADLYIEVAKAFPDNRMSQFNRTEDKSQLLHFARMGGASSADWTRQMLASVQRIDDATENFASFTARGDGHCGTLEDDFYDIEVGGTRLVDWLRRSLDGKVETIPKR